MTIKEYYEQYNAPPFLLKKKLEKFDNNDDIKQEFEIWINSGEYVKENPVTIEGYTAESLSKVSKYLNGEGAFMMLMELRENPAVATKKLSSELKIK